MICEFCGYEDESDDRDDLYGCPNCNGEGLDLTDMDVARIEDHIAFEGNVELKKWIDTSAHGFKITLSLENRQRLDSFDGVMAMRKSRGGQRYQAIVTPYWVNIDHGRQPDETQAFVQEWQFCGRGWSESGGAHIAVHLGDSDAIQWWRMKKAADQVEAGERGSEYLIMLLELDDDETIVNQTKRQVAIAPPPDKGGPRSKHVARMIQDPEFGLWLTRYSLYASHEEPYKYDLTANRDALVKRVCGMVSKVELDNGNETAWQKWDSQFKTPFIKWSQRR